MDSLSSATMDWVRLVEERNAWIAHNFPNAAKTDTILGVIEEYGELTHGLLKKNQSIRGSAEVHDEDMQDAIGDMTVYLLGVMSYSGLVPTTFRSFSGIFTEPDDVIFAMSRPIHMISYFQFEDKVHEPMEDLIGMMEAFCNLHDWDYRAIVEDTWHGVSQRDWITYPGNGKTH